MLTIYTYNVSTGDRPIVLGAMACLPGVLAVPTASVAYVGSKSIYEIGQYFLSEEQQQEYDELGDTFYKKSKADEKSKSGYKDSAISGMPDPDSDGEHERKENCSKQESKVWKEFDNYRDGIKTNGKSGGKKQYTSSETTILLIPYYK